MKSEELDNFDDLMSSEDKEHNEDDKPSFKLDSKLLTPKNVLIHKRGRSPPKSRFFIGKAPPNKRKGTEDLTKKRKPSDFLMMATENQLINFNRNFNLLKNDFSVLESYEKQFFKDTTLDIMFIMDITGSMGMWLDEAKSKITNIITEIIENNPCSKIRISFVGYRDFTENPNPVGQYESIDFTNNAQEVKDFISTIEAYGGGDEPEDIVGALDLALKMKWESNARYAILVCDAPCHGKQYHKVIYDKYSDGDPNGLILEEVLSKFVDKNITLYAVEINESTEIMYNIMSKVYEKSTKATFHKEKLNNSNQFAFFVAFSASETLGNITYNVVKLEEVIKNFRKDIIAKIVKKYNKDIINKEDISEDLINQINSLNLEEEEKNMFNFINRMSSLNLNKEKNNLISNNHNQNDMKIDDVDDDENKEVCVNINKNDFKENMLYNSTLHHFEIKTNDQIAINWEYPTAQNNKIDTQIQINDLSSFIFDEQNEKYKLKIYDSFLERQVDCSIDRKIKQKYLNNLINLNNFNDLLKLKLTNGAICQVLADNFNLRMSEKLGNIKRYIKFPHEIIFELKDNAPCKFLFAKVANNLFSNIIIRSLNKQVIDAFTHFSFQFTEGIFIVTDLKYDPDTNVISDYNMINVNKNGQCHVMNFFVTHFCSDFCRKLDLIHPRKKNSEIKLTKDFFIFDTVFKGKLCELCKIPFSGNEDYCLDCSEKVKNSEKKVMCSECRSMFTYSSYYYLMKLMKFPTKCDFCTFSF